MSDISLDSFLDRLGLEDDNMRVCVWLAFMTERDTLPGEETTACLGWVAAVHEGKLLLATFHSLLNSFLKGLGNPLTPEELESVATCMLSGHAEPEPEQ